MVCRYESKAREGIALHIDVAVAGAFSFSHTYGASDGSVRGSAPNGMLSAGTCFCISASSVRHTPSEIPRAPIVLYEPP